jgi:hypothetical protein
MDHLVERIELGRSGGFLFLTSILLIYKNCPTALLTINDAASPSPFLLGGLPTTADHVDDDTTILPWCLDPLTKTTLPQSS